MIQGAVAEPGRQRHYCAKLKLALDDPMLTLILRFVGKIDNFGMSKPKHAGNNTIAAERWGWIRN